MEVMVDISLYPLQENYKDPIKRFIVNLSSHINLRVVRGDLSTTISGEIDEVMSILGKELKEIYKICPNSVAVTKIVHTACKR